MQKNASDSPPVLFHHNFVMDQRQEINDDKLLPFSCVYQFKIINVVDVTMNNRIFPNTRQLPSVFTRITRETNIDFHMEESVSR